MDSLLLLFSVGVKLNLSIIFFLLVFYLYSTYSRNIWEPSQYAREGMTQYLTIIRRDVINPVAPDSALAVFVAKKNDDELIDGWVFLGRVGREFAEIIGPLVSSSIIRVGVARVHWHTYTRTPQSEWFIDLAIVVRDSTSEAQQSSIVDAVRNVAAQAIYPSFDVASVSNDL